MFTHLTATTATDPADQLPPALFVGRGERSLSAFQAYRKPIRVPSDQVSERSPWPLFPVRASVHQRSPSSSHAHRRPIRVPCDPGGECPPGPLTTPLASSI